MKWHVLLPKLHEYLWQSGTVAFHTIVLGREHGSLLAMTTGRPVEYDTVHLSCHNGEVHVTDLGHAADRTVILRFSNPIFHHYH